MLMKTKTLMAKEACTMPQHGHEDATAACCRPSSPHFAGSPIKNDENRATSLRFWLDRTVWRIASRNTLNCLIGCMIGDLGMIIFLQAFYPQTPMWLTMGLAMAAGLVTSILFESCLLHYRERFAWGAAFKMAFSMSFLSMLGMELAANATDFMLTGGRIPLSDPFYWKALAISVGAGFLTPLPYNYWKFKKRGKACH
jgi:hypothetical protein